MTEELTPSEPVESSPAPLVEVEGLTVHFPVRGHDVPGGKAFVRAVDGVSLSIRRGETLGLVGESGCGKSTTGRAILQLDRPTAGTVSFDGIELTTLPKNELRRMRRRMQMIFQDPHASLDPRMTIGRAIAEPLSIHGLASGAEQRRRVDELLELVGLAAKLKERYPHEFSGGQRQRIGIARALAVEPELVVADEPISSLDVSIQSQIVNLLEELQSRLGLTYLFIAHDLAVVRHVSDRVAVMYLGRIVEAAGADELYERPIHPYTQSLLLAVPIPDPAVEARRRRIILKGDVPNAVSPPSGCRFHPRCPLREAMGGPDICVTDEPQLVASATGHAVACHFPAESQSRSVQ
jgi:oligopeptide transport system ATP-binding protein